MAGPAGQDYSGRSDRQGVEEHAEIVQVALAAGAICAAESARIDRVNGSGASRGEFCQGSRSDVFRSAIEPTAWAWPFAY